MDNIITDNKIGVKDIHKLCFQKHYSFVSYRLPSEEKIHTIVQPTVPLRIDTIEQLNDKKGFVFAPFRLSTETPAYILEQDIFFDDDDFELIQKVFNALQEMPVQSQLKNTGKPIPSSTLQEEYISMVNQSKDIITKGKVSKLVLSRAFSKRREKKSLSGLYRLLEQAYKHAFVYIFYTPALGCWIGATPEPLLISDDHLAQTISLAGTRSLKTNQEVVWSDKEKKEQEIVTEFIKDILKQHNIRHYHQSGPETFEAGNVAHLLTSFQFDMGKIKDKVWDFIFDLHPTPSVCGLPKTEALQLLESIENHERDYYTGVLGLINKKQNLNLYVNLRCMQVTQDAYLLYTGAGITDKSDALAEWEETEQKKDTLLSVIEKFENSSATS